MAGHDEGTCMPTDAPAWSLHSRLKEDTIDIGDLPLCRVLVIKDGALPVAVAGAAPARRRGDHRPRRGRTGAIDDGDFPAARSLKEITKCDKLNIAALGNLVPQLTRPRDRAPQRRRRLARPVWGVMPPLAQDAEEVQNFISALRRKIWLG